MAILAALKAAQGIVGGLSKWGQAEQIETNAGVMAQDMANRRQAMLSARLANSKREATITSNYLADMESSYSISGIEMSGDIANYVAQHAAMAELNTQQLNQDAYYAAAVMDVQKENMQMAAKQKSKALKIGAIAGLFGAQLVRCNLRCHCACLVFPAT